MILGRKYCPQCVSNSADTLKRSLGTRVSRVVWRSTTESSGYDPEPPRFESDCSTLRDGYFWRNRRPDETQIASRTLQSRPGQPSSATVRHCGIRHQRLHHGKLSQDAG